jgi:hypothetical protein
MFEVYEDEKELEQLLDDYERALRLKYWLEELLK